MYAGIKEICKSRSYHKFSTFNISLILALLLVLITVPPVSAVNAFDNGNFDSVVVNSSGSGINCWTTDITKAVNGISVGIGRYDTFYYSSPYSLKYTISSTTGWYNAYIYQYADLTNANYINFTLRMAGGTGYKNLTVKMNGTAVYVWHPTSIDTTYYVSVPVSSAYKNSNMRVDIGFNSTGGDGYWYGLIDDVYAESDPSVATDGELYSDDSFEYGNSGNFYADMNSADGVTYYIDIYGVDSDSYDLLSTDSFVNPAGVGSGSNVISYTAPSSSSGYQVLYAVLRTSENLTFDEYTVPLVENENYYFKFWPKNVSIDGSTTLYYGYDYSSVWPSSVFDVRYDYYYPGGSIAYSRNETIINNLANTNYSRLIIPASNYAFVAPCTLGYGLYRDSWGGSLVTGMQDTFTINNNSSIPEKPEYVYNNSSLPDDEPEDVPEVPDNYTPPDYPDPSNPSDENNTYYNPVYNNTTYYDSVNNTWIYYNTTYFNNSSGYYQLDVPGNVSVDTSLFDGYYDTVDSTYSPLNRTLYGVVSFTLSPVRSITGYLQDFNYYLNSSTAGLTNESFLGEVVGPLSNGLPSSIQLLITFSLSLTVLLFILRSGQ